MYKSFYFGGCILYVLRFSYKAYITKSVNNFIKEQAIVQSYANESCSLFLRQESELIELKDYPVSRGNITAYVEFTLNGRLICASSKGNIVTIDGNDITLNENDNEEGGKTLEKIRKEENLCLIVDE